MENEKVIVDRRKWLRGEGNEDSYLLRPADGKMCCLGFYCVTKGFGDVIANLRSPAALRNEEFHKLSSPSISNYDWLDNTECGNLMCENDYREQTDEEREQKIIEIGKRVGIDFIFVN